MNLSEPFVRRPVMTVVSTLSIVLFGAVCFLQLPVNDLPAVDYPVIQVLADYPGASPETMASTVATPLERRFMQINGLQTVTSESRQGHTSLTLEFKLDKSLDGAATDVQTAISQATPFLPADLPSPPTFSKTNPNDRPVMYIALTSNTFTRGRLYDFASTQVAQRISIVSGVSRVDVFGTKGAVRIKVNPDALTARDLSIDDIADAVRGGTSTVGAGQLDSPSGTLLVRPQGQLDDAASYADLVVKSVSGASVRLGDVAEVVDSVENERMSMRFWDRDIGTLPKATVVLAVNRQAGANAVEVAKNVRALVPVVTAELPGDVRILPVYDRSRAIVRSIVDVEETLLIAFVLVVLVIFVFLGRVADTLIPAIALPLSLLVTFIVMKMLGYSLDNLSLMALTLAVGFLVDDAIVFLENVVRRMERGERALEATLASAKEIAFTILSMTVSLAAVFIPLVAMPGLMGRIFREFAVTIIVAILASGLVSLTLTPLMCSRILKPRGHGAKQTFMERAFGAVERRVLAGYGRSLTWFLRRRWISGLVWLLCLAGTWFLFTTIRKSFLPVGDSSVAFGLMLSREGASPEQMKALQTEVDDVLHADPNVLRNFSVTGNPGFFASNRGILFIFLRGREDRGPIDEATGALMGRLSSIPGVSTFLQPFPVLEVSTGAVSQTAGKYSFTVSGVDAATVYEVSGRLMQKFMTFPGFATVLSDRFANTPNLDVSIKREQARASGVSETRILALLRDAYAQNYVYLIKKPTDQYQVVLELDDASRTRPDALGKLRLRSDDGRRLVSVEALATWATSVGPQSVNHLNQFPSVTFSFNLKPGVSVGEATEFITKTAAAEVPITLRAGLQGEALIFQEAVADLTLLMGLAVFVMYVILAILYESYVHPLTVLSTLPTALVGGLAALHVFGEQATLYAFVGMFMLMGIVKKNGILIVDFARHRVDAGEDPVKAIHDASLDRFRPILMTTLAAVLGAVPIAAGFGADGASRRPLGLVVVWGLVVSQLVTLYVTPVLYLYFEAFQRRVLDRVPFFRATHVGAAVTGNPPTRIPALVPEAGGPDGESTT